MFASVFKAKPGQIKTSVMDNQPRWMFVVDGNEMTAASLVPYTKTDHTVFFLLVQVAGGAGLWQTLGGKISETDLHWKNTAMREFLEETGYCLSSRRVIDALNDGTEDVVYVKYAKHGYWFHEVSFVSKEGWREVNAANMSEEDRKKVLAVAWISMQDLENVQLRPDVKCALDFMIARIKAQA